MLSGAEPGDVDWGALGVDTVIGGPIDGKIALIFDDMISTAGSIVGAANVAKAHGAAEVYVSGTHPLRIVRSRRPLNYAAVLHLVVDRRADCSVWKLLLQKLDRVVYVIRHEVLNTVAAAAVAAARRAAEIRSAST